jgi:hypothetical protein
MRYASTVFAATALALPGCFVASFFVPVSKTPADQAHELDKKCRGFSDPASLSVLIPNSAIDSVEPAYSHVVDPPADHLRGAQIHVRPWQGLSKESLTRSLECHEASVVLGHVPSVEDDPYMLPEHWVDIDVDSEGDSFVVWARVDAFPDAQKVLARAKRYFAAVRRPLPPPSAFPVSAAVTASAPPVSASPAAAASTPPPAAPPQAAPAAASPTPVAPAQISPAAVPPQST